MIYYIYKVRRKQTSIYFSRSALPHRYLRYISWISWVRRPQPSISWVFRLCRNCAHTASRRRLYPRPQQLRSCYRHIEQLLSNLSPRKRKTILFLSLAHLSYAAPLVLLCPQPFARAAIRGRSITSFSAALPQTKNAGPQHCAANPLTTFIKRAQKSVDFSLKKNTRRHARLSRSCFGRNRRPAFTTALFPFSFFTKKKKKENRSKFSRFEYIARTHFVRPHDVRDWPRASSAETKVAKSTDFCFIFESLPISL